MNRRDLIKSVAASSIGFSALKATAQPMTALGDGLETGMVPAPPPPNRFVQMAESLKPVLNKERCPLVRTVTPDAKPEAYLRWEMPASGSVEELEKRLLKPGDVVYLDFGKHITGYLHMDVSAVGINIDSPCRLRLTYGEVPGDVAENFYPYKGILAGSWLPDEVVNLDPLPLAYAAARRHAFRYVKVEVVAVSPKYLAQLSNCYVEGVSSAKGTLASLPAGTPEALVKIDRVALNTLKDCMQTVFEDGPRRDQRLWIGDFRLQALASYATYRNLDLVKRCLYLLAAFPQPDGMLSACVFEKPFARIAGDVILDYAAIYNIALREYLDETNDLATVKELWPSAIHQIDLIAKLVDEKGRFVDPKNIWIFIDWETALHRDAAMQGVILCSLRSTIVLAGRLGEHATRDWLQKLLEKMTVAAREAFYDPGQKLFVSGPDRQISWASQAWLTLAGVLPQKEAAEVLLRAQRCPGIVAPATPYLNHYIVQAMVACGLYAEAEQLMTAYWGGMVERGADTFWEVYDAKDSMASPYGDVHINSFCHAWSCTPTYFLRSRGKARG